MTVTKKAYGKVNLFLSVGALRADGRHDVENVMCRAGIYDTVTVCTSKNGIAVDCEGVKLLSNEDNLAYVAAKKYIDKYGISGGVDIRIEKRIPVKAGMAGGSTDCAATLSAMNEIFGKATDYELVQIASEIGADVPFFLYDRPIMLGRGTGTELSSFPELKQELYGLFVTHGHKQSTGAMFSLLDQTRKGDLVQKDAEKLRLALDNGALDEILAEMHNDFEICTEHFEQIKTMLCENGARRVLLSGSGPTVFGIYESEETARAAACVVPYPCFVCKIGI